jgi:hypothetical protein
MAMKFFGKRSSSQRAHDESGSKRQEKRCRMPYRDHRRYSVADSPPTVVKLNHL